MNVVIDIQSLLEKKPGGIQTYTSELIQTLAKAYPQDTFYLYSQSFRKPIESELVLLSVILSTWANVQWTHRKIPNSLAWILCLLFPAIILVRSWFNSQGIKPNIFVCTNSVFNSSLRGIPYIATAHDCSFIRNPGWYSWRARFWHWRNRIPKFLQNAKMIVTVSNETKKDVVELFKIDASRVSVVEPFCENVKCKMLNVKCQTIDVLRIYTLGVVEKRKNLECITKALKLIASSVQIQWDIVGPMGFGGKKILKDIYLVNRSNIKINYHGQLSIKDKLAIIETAEVLVYPSFYEGYGYPVIEAKKLDKWIITSAATSLPEAAQSNKTILINPFDPMELVQALLIIVKKRKEPLLGELENIGSTEQVDVIKYYQVLEQVVRVDQMSNVNC